MASKPEVVSSEVLAIPSPLGLQQSELHDSLIGLQRDAVALPRLKAAAAGLEVTDAQSYAVIGSILTEARNIKGTPQNRLGTFYTIVQRVRTFLDTEANKVKNACTEIEAICLPKMKAYEQKEKAATAKEQAKAPEGATVKPNLPTVSGYRRTTNYYATFDTPQDFDKMLRRFFTTKSRDERTYLRKFLTWDEKALNAEAREVKDPKEIMKKIPGTRAWSV